ncbi:hypothetical protein CYMTET_18094 [Cymbomonas tetramitiformis]|uniref:Patatin n=1 Tax=Cymbomonas tetramitiformis TaxID=36881 RepID=A0AAE0G8Z1_9CHLO|nr:hypothetical protein CYMTET_18094 [Cymbomonas tetramitiformis]
MKGYSGIALASFLAFNCLSFVASARTEVFDNGSLEPCRVLALSGGGSYGAFEAGVLAKLIKDDILLDFDYITGVSAGALNAIYLATYPKLISSVIDLQRKWEDTKTENVYKSGGGTSLFNTEPLKETIELFMRGRNVVRPVSVGATDLSDGSFKIFHEDTIKTDYTSIAMASSAIPVAFPPIAYNGTFFSDGGTLSNEILLEGANRCGKFRNVEVTAILCSGYVAPVNKTSMKNYNFTDFAMRNLQIVLNSFDTFELLNKCSSSRVKVSTYEPSPAIKEQISFMDFNQGKRLWDMGFNVGDPECHMFDVLGYAGDCPPPPDTRSEHRSSGDMAGACNEDASAAPRMRARGPGGPTAYAFTTLGLPWLAVALLCVCSTAVGALRSGGASHAGAHGGAFPVVQEWAMPPGFREQLEDVLLPDFRSVAAGGPQRHDDTRRARMLGAIEESTW